MICTGTTGMSTLDFYLSLKVREDMESCCGPIVYLKFNSVVANRLHLAASELELENTMMRAFVSLISDDMALFGSCMAHWIDISSIAYTMGKQMERPDIQTVGEMVFRKTCAVLGWDHRELDNYLVSLSAGGEDTDDFVC